MWVSRDPVAYTRQYCEKNNIQPSDVLADPPYRTYFQLGLEGVPYTLVVGTQGVVEKAWKGRLTSENISELQNSY